MRRDSLRRSNLRNVMLSLRIDIVELDLAMFNMKGDLDEASHF